MLAPELLADRNREQVRDNLRFISMLDGILVRRDSLEEQKTKRTSNFKDPVSIDQLINIEDVLTNNLHGSKALQEHIKSSNMILISLGFNDLFRPLLEQFLTILDTSFERLKEEDKPFVQLNSFVRSFEKIVKELSENYLYLIQSIKRLNPQAEIVILSYPASNLNLLTGIFDSIIRIFSES